MTLRERLKLKDKQAIINAKRILSHAELVIKEDLEEGRGIDDGWDDQPPQTLYECFVERNGKYIPICTMYVNGTRVLGFYPYRITKCCHTCGLLANDPDKKSEPELDSLFVTLLSSGAVFEDVNEENRHIFRQEPDRWECLECQQTMGFGYDFWDAVEEMAERRGEKETLN